MISNGQTRVFMEDEDVANLIDLIDKIDNLSLTEREKIAEKLLNSLPVDKKSKILEKQLSNSGLVVVMPDCTVISTSEIVFNIQHTPNIDFTQIVEAMINRKRNGPI